MIRVNRVLSPDELQAIIDGDAPHIDAEALINTLDEVAAEVNAQHLADAQHDLLVAATEWFSIQKALGDGLTRLRLGEHVDSGRLH